jgi:4-hydroxy-tetrahydrodipicolinate reductase
MRTSDQPIRISLMAPEGRMGQAIAAAVAEDGGYALDQDHGDVLVDFSAPAALQASLDRAASAGVPILIGTTGLDELADRRMAEAAKDIAVLHAPNTSLGVALLADLVERAAKALDWDIEIAETHHRMKADAPSGTALALGEAAARGRGVPLNAERGRDGTGLKREPGAIGFAALRGRPARGDRRRRP